MADKRIIQLPNTPGVDTATDEMVVGNATDGTRRIPVGRAGGVAVLDANSDLVALKAIRTTVPAYGQVALADADGLIRKGMIIIVTDGNSSPGHVMLNIFRNGTYNEAVASANINWVVGDTTDPGTGAFRVWVDGQVADAPLILKSTVNYGRGVRILQFPVTL